MPGQRWTKRGELACLAVFFCWLALLPLPFGAVIEKARVALIAVPLGLCIIVALLRLHATRDRTNTAQPTRAWAIWAAGAMLFLALIALQLVPLSPSLLAEVSPDSHAIWSSGTRLARLAGLSPRTAWPVTVDVPATRLELFRIGALLATFMIAALLVRTSGRRQALAIALSCTAIFEVLFGVHEAALKRFEIWGWVNRMLFGRVTGTFVNPNHFAHYLAIVLPMALFTAAVLWHRAGDPETRAGVRLARVMEHALLYSGFAVFTIVACLTGILLSQSRGGLLSLASGSLLVAAMLPGRKILRLAFGTGAALVVLLALVLFLGPERTVRRFTESDDSLAGRRIGLVAAFRVWERFSILGSGAGTFERVVSQGQGGDPTKIFHHAHNDYAEIAATTGTAGITIVVVALLGGYVALMRMTFGERAPEISWSRRAFQAAALASLSIAMIHALIDFNFFIPANPATLAAIAGASVASLDHDKRTRR